MFPVQGQELVKADKEAMARPQRRPLGQEDEVPDGNRDGVAIERSPRAADAA